MLRFVKMSVNYLPRSAQDIEYTLRNEAAFPERHKIVCLLRFTKNIVLRHDCLKTRKLHPFVADNALLQKGEILRI